MSEDETTPLSRRLIDRIKAEGPIGVDALMEAALFDPDFGRYAAGAPIGAEGDFTTAPEVSQMFGELIGLWAVQCWRDMGAPDRFNLIELGPGRGTLMKDALRAARLDPDFTAAADVTLIERSRPLRARQSAALQEPAIRWADELANAPEGPAILIANEFLDCLPIRQWLFDDGRWRERRVDAAEDGLVFVAASAAAKTPPPALPDDRPFRGAVFETCERAKALARELGERMRDHHLHALFIDYGHGRPAYGETLQALRRHGRIDPLMHLGDADVTAHVDFAAFAGAAVEAGAKAHGPVTQRAFLSALGVHARAEALVRAAPARSHEVLNALHRLTAPDAMGELFKVICLSNPSLTPPPGFPVQAP